MVTTPPKYVVETADDGGLSIRRSDGEACTDDERDFIASAITTALRAASFAKVRKPVHERAEGRTKGNQPFEIDPFIRELEEIRLGVPGLTKRQLSRELGWREGKITDITRGICRPQLDELRDWAATPGIGMTPVLIPAALVRVVGHMKDLYRQRGQVPDLQEDMLED